MIRTEQPSERVLLVTLDRPERRNAVDLDGVTALGDALLGTDARVAVVTGAGGHFSAGADLGGVDQDVFVTALTRALDALRQPRLVTMAAIDGAALGVGVQLSVCADLRVATPTARIGIPAAKLGLAVDHESLRRLASMVGEGTARAMALATLDLDGRRAFDLGLVQKLGDLDVALEWAAEIAALAPLTIAAHKLGLELAGGRADHPDYDAARRRAWDSADLQEGIAAFRDRRPPTFTGH
jgi:enoyl-CoA hydratase